MYILYLKNAEVKAKFMISTETTTKQDNVYWLTNNDMINLHLITKCRYS